MPGVSEPARIVSFEARDIRFPTSRLLDGSDAMHPDPDYSAAYVVLRTDADDGVEGHGLTFTIGRGTEICVLAARPLARRDRVRHGRLLAQPRQRPASPLARPREGRRAPHRRSGRERELGPL